MRRRFNFDDRQVSFAKILAVSLAKIQTAAQEGIGWEVSFIPGCNQA